MINEKEISKITVSIGIAEYQRNESDQQFVYRGDSTMYDAKLREGSSVIISPEMKELPITAILQHSLRTNYSTLQQSYNTHQKIIAPNPYAPLNHLPKSLLRF